jgi:hypothetical protein
VGGLTANLLNSQTDPKVWRASVEPTQALYPWLMNNHSATNYRAYQEGPVTFRFAVRAHAGYDPAAATRLATGLSQPLLALPAAASAPTGGPRLRLTNDRVVVTALKPSDDGHGWIVRLYNVSESGQQVGIEGGDPKPARVFQSATSEARAAEVRGPLAIPAWGLVTLRAERGQYDRVYHLRTAARCRVRLPEGVPHAPTGLLPRTAVPADACAGPPAAGCRRRAAEARHGRSCSRARVRIPDPLPQAPGHTTCGHR